MLKTVHRCLAVEYAVMSTNSELLPSQDEGIKWFLRRSALELFALQIVVPFASMVIGGLGQSYGVMVAGAIVGAAAQCLWLVAISRGSNSYLPAALQRSTVGMEVGLVYVAVYGAVFIYLVFNGSPGLWLFGFHLAAMAALFYAIWFSARQLSALRHGAYSFEKTFRYFVLLWFFPIGVWVLQPIIQRMMVRSVRPSA
jgi:hypothetical protein